MGGTDPRDDKLARLAESVTEVRDFLKLHPFIDDRHEDHPERVHLFNLLKSLNERFGEAESSIVNLGARNHVKAYTYILFNVWDTLLTNSRRNLMLACAEEALLLIPRLQSRIAVGLTWVSDDYRESVRRKQYDRLKFVAVEYKRLLAEYLADAYITMNSQLRLAPCVLFGAVAEGLLHWLWTQCGCPLIPDSRNKDQRKKRSPKEITLHDLTSWAKTDFESMRSVISHVEGIRYYRNWIHIERRISDTEPLTENNPELAERTISQLIEFLRKNSRKLVAQVAEK